MPWIRRTRHLVLTEPGDGPSSTLPALSLLTGEPTDLSLGEVDELLGLSAREWTWRLDETAVSLARRGLVVSDEQGEPFEALRQRDKELTALGWHTEAAGYHLASRWQGVRAAVGNLDGSHPPRGARYGQPQPAFSERGGTRLTLPDAERDSELYRVLRDRRTARSFEPEQPVTADELSTLLRWVWGAHGAAPLALGDTALRKTSPSGGGLHPIEVYPIVRNADGVEPGVYHYRVRDHELERLQTLTADRARILLEQATAGQWYFAEADVAFVMTARFARSFWKYRRHPKAFRTLLLDAGHLSQTFYLVCTQLGLGPFVTAALNDDELEHALEVDPLREAPLALCGCGRLPERPGPLDPIFRAFGP